MLFSEFCTWKPTPGSKIADLTNIIEQQLHRRSTLKPAGGVDPLLAAMEEIDKNQQNDETRHASMTDLSSNTLATSQWHDNGSYHSSRPGSAVTLSGIRDSFVSTRPSSGIRDSFDRNLETPVAPVRRRLTSWDSD